MAYSAAAKIASRGFSQVRANKNIEQPESVSANHTNAPGTRRVENESWFPVAILCQCRPTWIDNSLPPLSEHFHPGVQVKCEVMACQNSQEKKRANDRESSRADDEEWAWE